MNELHCDNLWKIIKHLAKKRNAKRAAVAYVTSDEHVKFGDGDMLVTDASDIAIKSGQTAAAVLARAFKRGAELFSLPGLHSKVLLLGGAAIIGSVNLSISSEKDLIEAAWVTNHPTAVSMAISLVESLAEKAIPVDEGFLQHIQSLEVTPRRWGRQRGEQRKPRISIQKPQTWIIGVHELARDFPEEKGAIAEGQEIAERNRTYKLSKVSWIRWTGRSHFQSKAKRGDSVIQIWRATGDKKPALVFRHAPIVYRQVEPTCTRFYIEESLNADKTALTWGKFQRLIKRVGLPGRIGPASSRQVKDEHAEALFALWGE